MAKKLSPSAQKLEDELIRLSKTTKVRPKQVKSTDKWQFTDFKQTNEMFENSPKSEGEIDDGCLITSKNDEQGYQGDGTEWIYEQDEDGTIYKRMMGSDKKERLK